MAIPFHYNIRSVTARWVSSIVAVIGIAGTVAVFIAMESLANGFRATLIAAGSPENVIVLRGGATAEMESAVTRDQARTIGDAPGVARGADGAPLVSAEVVCIANLPKIDTGTDANVQIRGMNKVGMDVRRNVSIAHGRFFRPGIAELVVGQNVVRTIRGMQLGARPRFGGRDWEIVGVFDSGGTAIDSEIWCDASLLSQTFDRPLDIFQSVLVRLKSPDSFQEFKDWLTSNPALTVQGMRETAYYAKQSEFLSMVIMSLGFLVAFVMGIGAVFGALNTMYSAVAARTREIATLRALGFKPGSVIVAFVLESLLIAFVGGLVGALAALPFNGLGVSTINWQTFSHMAFAFRVSPGIILQGIIFAVLMGLVGGLLPAIRAARLPVASALREL